MNVLRRLKSHGATFRKPALLISTPHFFQHQGLYELVCDRLKVTNTNVFYTVFKTCFRMLLWHLLPGNLGQNYEWAKRFIKENSVRGFRFLLLWTVQSLGCLYFSNGFVSIIIYSGILLLYLWRIGSHSWQFKCCCLMYYKGVYLGIVEYIKFFSYEFSQDIKSFLILSLETLILEAIKAV